MLDVSAVSIVSVVSIFSTLVLTGGATSISRFVALNFNPRFSIKLSIFAFSFGNALFIFKENVDASIEFKIPSFPSLLSPAFQVSDS